LLVFAAPFFCISVRKYWFPNARRTRCFAKTF
jgi:hypothetical protein